jgi:hypothetical protein
MSFPIVWANPQRPDAQFTLQDNDGRYLTPTGDYIYADALRTYILSGFSSMPSASDVKTAQRALGLPETGELDFDTLAAIVNAQLATGKTPTGIPDAPTLAAIAQMISTGQSPAESNNKKKPKDNSGEIMTLAVLAFVVMFVFRGGD